MNMSTTNDYEDRNSPTLPLSTDLKSLKPRTINSLTEPLLIKPPHHIITLSL